MKKEKMVVIEELVNKIFKHVNKLNDSEIIFEEIGGKKWRMYHAQGCCEQVYLDDICGDLKDLENSPLYMAEVITNQNIPAKSQYSNSYTWTFYKFATKKGYVTLRWYGESNGYYSEWVSIDDIENI